MAVEEGMTVPATIPPPKARMRVRVRPCNQSSKSPPSKRPKPLRR